MTDFEIIRETKKAKLLKIENIEFWVKNAWVNKNGELTPAGLKSYEEACYVPNMDGHEFSHWSPETGFGRYYFEDRSYVQYRQRDSRGSYENHRACKGEKFYTITKTEGIAVEIKDETVKLYLPF